MGPRRDPAKPSGKTRIPKAGGASPKVDGKSTAGDAGPTVSDDESSEVTQSSALEKILARFDSVETEIRSVKDTVDEGIRAQEFNASQFEDKLKQHVADCVKTSEVIESLREDTDGLQARASYQSFRLTDLEIKIEQLERERRKNLMIVEGVVETEGVHSPDIIDDLFADLKLDFDSHVCDRIYRRGKETPATSFSAVTADLTGSAEKPTDTRKTRPRSIVVGFMRPIEKSKVFKNLKNLKGVERWNRVFFTDDYTEQQKNQIRDLRALAAYARRIGREATVRNHHLWVDGRRYVYDELSKLSPELTLEKAKTLEVLGGSGLAFQSSHSPLSNLYPCNVYHRGGKFLSSEAAIHHTRATISRRPREAQDILETRDPYKVKGIGSSFKASREWEEKEDAEYDSILLDKFTRNQYCRDFLVRTGDKKLFEATGDRKWACGIPLTKIDTLTDAPPGENRMGKKLEVVRQKVKAKLTKK